MGVARSSDLRCDSASEMGSVGYSWFLIRKLYGVMHSSNIDTKIRSVPMVIHQVFHLSDGLFIVLRCMQA